MTFDGGCACGALRFTAAGQPLDAGYCHCRLCQRTTGAIVLAWASFPSSGFAYTRGEPARYRSSTRGHREFCSACGTQIAYRDSGDARSVEVNVGALDDCESVRPRYHIWCDSRVSWFDTDDDLPRFATSKPRDIDT